MKLFFTVFLAFFMMALGFSQEHLDEWSLGGDVEQINPDGLASPTTIEQRLVAVSKYRRYFSSTSYDSTRYFFAEATDGFYSIRTTYKYDIDSVLVYNLTDTLEFDNQDRLIATRYYQWSQDVFVPKKRKNITYSGLFENWLYETYDASLGTWKDFRKVSIEYYTNGKMKEYSNFLWDGDAQEWILDTYLFKNEAGYLLEKQFLSYNNTKRYKYLYEYDANNRLLKYTNLEKDTSSQSYDFVFKIEWTPVGDTLSTGYTYTGVGTDWVLNQKKIVHFENQKKINELILDSIGPGEYENYQLRETSYTALGETLDYRLYKWNKSLTPPAWELRKEKIGTTNSDDLIVSKVFKVWVEDSMKVVPKYIFNYEYDLNGNKIYGQDLRWDFDSKEWNETGRKYWYYEDYVTGLRDIHDLAKIELNVFPNPSSDYVIFDIKYPVKNLKVYFYSADGSPLFSKEISGNQQVDVRALHPGVYNYIIKGDGVGTTGQFVKE